MKVIFLNGPPSSGKDTAAAALAAAYGGFQQKFATPLGRAVCAFFDLPPMEYHRLREKDKNKQEEQLFGKCMREVMISLSENWAKPKFGTDVFGRLAARRLSPRAKLYIFSDCGFTEEVIPVVAKAGAENCLLIQLSREGCSFTGDNRSYVELDSVPTRVLENTGTVQEFQRRVITLVRDFLE